MNNTIKNELNKVSSVKLVFDDNTTHIVIPKTEKILSTSMKVGKVYKLLSNNEEYVCEVLSINNDEVKLNGVSTSNNLKTLFGWFKVESLQILEKDL